MRWLLTCFIALAAGFAGAAAWDFSGLGDRSTRQYLLANPEVLPEAMNVLEARRQQALIEPLRAELERPFPGAVLGNPEGSITLVEFSDYACGYCRQSMADVTALIAANPDLRVVIREYPILTAGSAAAARMALAAARQGKYAAFHDAMFRLGTPTEQTIAAAAERAGLNLPEARALIASGTLDAQLQTNAMLADSVGVTGTPAWIVGNRALSGAVGRAVLSDAIEEARQS